MTGTLLVAAPKTARRLRNDALLQHRPLVTRLARRMRFRLPANVLLDDLVQAGMLGLDKALTGFEEERGVSFDTYASRRIQGAMLDELRSTDEMSREVRSRMRKIRSATLQLEKSLQRPPRAMEIANQLGLSLRVVHDTMVLAGAPSMRFGDGDLETAENEASMDDGTLSEDFVVAKQADPSMSLQRQQEYEAVNKSFLKLSTTQQSLLQGIYQHDRSQQDIAVELGVTPSRVSQLHSETVEKLKLLVERELTPSAEVARGAVRFEAKRLENNPDWLDRAAQSCLD